MRAKSIQLVSLLGATALAAVSCNSSIDKEQLIQRMSLETKAHFVIGTGMKGLTGDNAVVGSTQNLIPGAAGTTLPLDSLSIPPIVFADGPAGLRIDATREGDTATYYCTHFPIGTLLASTWNTELVEQVGRAMGNEVKEYGADVYLAPAINIMRNPLCGRNFEYYSEDPVVAGRTAAAYILGVQSNGVGTSIKHFAVNNQETNRLRTDAHVSQRALREIYLRGFEIAIKDAKPWTVMSSYNHINGQYASQSKELLTTILRDEWGYEGAVVTDWCGGNNGALQVWAGNDMLQPGKKDQFDSIVTAVRRGTLAEADLDRNVGRTLDLIARCPRAAGYAFSNHPDLKAHAAVTRQSATEGMVLLKNEGALPLGNKVKNIALYGCTSYDFIAGGTGSGNVNHAYVVSLLDGLKNAGYTIDADLKAQYEQIIAQHKAKVAADQEAEAKANPEKAAFVKFLPTPLPTEKNFSDAELAQQVAKADVAVITIGRLSGEFLDRSTSDFALTDGEQSLIESTCRAYHAAGKKVVVLLNVGGVIETDSWKAQPDAILCAWQAGQEGGNSVADVLSGKASPSGKLTMTWPIALTDHYSSRNFPMDEAPVINLSTDGQAEEKKNVSYTDYEEDIYVGYRYFDSFDVPVSFPFGFGLSYTTFAYSDAKIAAEGDQYRVTVTVKNSGQCAGKEVVQLYVAAPDAAKANKPSKELKAFAKTRTLKPGESQTLTLTVQKADLASFDTQASAWVVAEGDYQFIVAASAAEPKATLKAHATKSTTTVHNVLKPNVKLNLLHR